LNFLITPGRASVYAFRTSAPQKTSICRRSSPRQNRQGGRDVKFTRGQSARGHAREKAVRVIGKLRASRRTCSPSPNAPAAHSRRGSFPERQRRPCSDTHQSGLVESGNNSGVSKAALRLRKLNQFRRHKRYRQSRLRSFWTPIRGPDCLPDHVRDKRLGWNTVLDQRPRQRTPDTLPNPECRA
jgi:hypothetical protein